MQVKDSVKIVAALLTLSCLAAAGVAQEKAAPKAAKAARQEPKPKAQVPAKLPPLAAPDAEGFISLFNGKDLTGWVGDVIGYAVEDGAIRCMPGKGRNLYTAHQFGDFIFRFEFLLQSGTNNGIGIRAPLTGDAAYQGMEIQIIDDNDPRWAKIQPWQKHGSIYNLVPAKAGHLKPAGEWNTEEIRAVGTKITVVLNGVTIVDADLAEVRKTADPKTVAKHPGIDRMIGHIGFLGHGDRVDFRNLKIKPLPPYEAGPNNAPPEGFTALFNGKDLAGWKGLVKNPKERAKMSPEALADEQKKADESMNLHWKAVDGALVFDGKGKALCTAKDYGDFEMYVDWKIGSGGDSGIYLRGSPQVQIWQRPGGSGGLYNNKTNPSEPLVPADNPPMQWNRFRIKMIGDRVWVWLNGVKVVDNTVMENYWERDKPIYPTGQIELQDHGSTLWFRNIYIREIPAGEKDAK
jgi:hypothetical protein